MKLPSRHNSLSASGFAALLALGVSSYVSAAPFPLFTVDPNGAFGALGGPHPGPFQADKIIGFSSTLVTIPSTSTRHGEGWVNFSDFGNAAIDAVPPLISGLNANWQMWAQFKYDAIDIGDATFRVIDLDITFWVDPSIATPTAFTTASNDGAAPTVTPGADAFQIGAANLIAGVAYMNPLDGGSFNSTNNFNLFSPTGTSLFTAPVPFYTIQFDGFNNTSQGAFFDDPAHRFIVLNQATAVVDFRQVPEPGSLALLGIGLLGICISKATGKRTLYSVKSE